MGNSNRNQNDDLLQLLNGLIHNWEHEIVEFKQATNNFSQHEIGQYFSAISNEANLKGLQYGWLVFGVNNKTREIVSTDYRDTRGLESLKHEIAQNATGGITFTDVFEVYDGDNRVVMFKIPAAVVAIPTAWKGHYYGRDGESLSYLSLEELDRGQSRRDWSKQVIEGSSVKHLDAEAIRIAREKYKEKQDREHINTEVDRMNDEDFLTKIDLIRDSKLTNAAMVLLGCPDFASILDVPARVMWRFYGSNGIVKDYMEYHIPFITVVDRAYANIRNLTYRYLPNVKSLSTTITQQYDMDMLRELMNNCIAHMDYTIGGRIYLDEFEDTIVISNPGSFIPKDVRNVLKPGYRAPYYRNQLLSDAMKDLKMIDTVQMGILRVFNIQRDRYFPLPDYDLQLRSEVSVKVHGKLLDENYTRLLFSNRDFPIDTVFLLDRVKKKLPLDSEDFRELKRLGLIQGKIDNAYVTVQVNDSRGEQGQNTNNTVMCDKYYMDMIINYLQRHGSGTKADIIMMLRDILPGTLDEKRTENKAKYYLTTLRQKGIIQHENGSKRTGVWVLVENQIIE